MGACLAVIPSLILGLLIGLPIAMVSGRFAIFVVMVIAIPGVAAGAWIGSEFVRARVAPTLIQCESCGYLLPGSRGDDCPECGFPISAERKRYQACRIDAAVKLPRVFVGTR